MENEILEKFLKATYEKQTVSETSLSMYKRDILSFKNFLKEKSYKEATKDDIADYIKFLEKNIKKILS